MRKLLTTVWVLALATVGWVIGHNDDTKAQAAPTPIVQSAPVDLQLSFYKKAVESLTKRLEGKRDTIRLPGKTKYITKSVPVPVPYRVIQKDTLYVPILFLAKQGVREEKALNDNHSVRDSLCTIIPQEPDSVSY